MTDEDSPKIEFPCAYPIRIIGIEDDSFAREVLEVVRQFDDEVSPDQVSLRKSSGGRYTSVRVTITATGEPQLRALHEALKRIDNVKVVL